MGKITSITPQKRKGRVNINIDGEYSFAIFETALVDFDLYKNKELTEAEIKKIKEADDISKCLNAAYNYLSYRPRSEQEIRDKLKEKYQAALIEKTVVKLKELKYLNDNDFARLWVDSRGASRGKIALKNELLKKGVAKNIIESTLESINSGEELENAKALIESKSKYKNLTKNEAYKRVAPYLQRRGYSYNTVKKIIDELY